MSLIDRMAEWVDNATAQGGPMAAYLKGQQELDVANERACTYRDATAGGVDPAQAWERIYGAVGREADYDYAEARAYDDEEARGRAVDGVVEDDDADADAA